jgi:cytochrome b involved in lipid metabolism
MRKYLIYGVLVIVIIIGFYVWNMKKSYSPITQEDNSKTSTSTTASLLPTYTMTDIRFHNSTTSCYTAINGGVYDLTSWINQHPGGKENILNICGKDGSVPFNKQHKGESKPEKKLTTFKIGTLKQ